MKCIFPRRLELSPRQVEQQQSEIRHKFFEMSTRICMNCTEYLKKEAKCVFRLVISIFSLSKASSNKEHELNVKNFPKPPSCTSQQTNLEMSDNRDINLSRRKMKIFSSFRLAWYFLGDASRWSENFSASRARTQRERRNLCIGSLKFFQRASLELPVLEDFWKLERAAFYVLKKFILIKSFRNMASSCKKLNPHFRAAFTKAKSSEFEFHLEKRTN